MCDPRQELDNAFGTVSGWVSSTLSGLSSTIENVLKNPLPTIATIGLTAIGVPAPIANAMVTAATGGSMEDMVISLATSYAGGQIGAAIGDLAVPELGGIAGYGGAGDLAFQPAASEAILKTVISNASAQGATALLQGKDLDQVLNTALTGAVGGLINTSLRTQFGLDPSKFGDRLIGDATKAAVSSIFNGKDPGQAIGLALSNSAFGALANTAASGLKSTVKDLNDSTAEFETIKTQADGLREEIDSESTRLAGLSKELNSTSTALNSTQANIVASKDLLDIASNAYNGYFVVADPAAQEAFAKRMGFDVVQTYGENAQWAKNVQYATNGYYDAEGYRHYRQAIYTPDGEIDYNAQVAISGDFINIGTEAKAVAEQQAAYLNNTVPKFKEDVEKFNTQLATFNTDNTNLNTKVNTYTGLVTDLFGEDGKGGINKKIENLLVARDGYIEDLNENVASLTEAAGEQISGAAEDIVDDAVDLLDQNYRTSDEVAEAFANNEAFQGYEPSAADLAKFIGEGKDADLQTSIDSYVDENSIDLEELKEIAGAEGYSFTDAELQSLLQQGDEDAISSRLRSEFDAKAVTSDEARQALTIGGYKPTNADIAAFTGNRSEAALNRDAAIYVDPRYLDYDEARDIARQEGYGELSAAETLRLSKNRQVGQIDEQQGVQALRSLYDAQAVTRQEAYDAFRSLGYEPSEAELNRFMGKGDEANRLSSLQTEFDPLVTTEDEVRQMYKDLGLPEPTSDEIAGYIGKQAETDIYGRLEGVKEERDAEAARVAQKAEADQIFNAAEELRRAYDEEVARNAANEQTINLEDGSSVTLDDTGNVVEIVDPDGQVTDLRTDTVEGGTDTIKGGEDTVTSRLDVIEGGEDTVESGADLDTVVGGENTTQGETGLDIFEGGEDTAESGAGTDTAESGTGLDILEGGEDTVAVEEEPERIAREAAEELERQRAALTLPGEAGEDTLEPVEAEPEVDRAQVAADAGFPSEYLYDLYGGDIERYRQEEAEYAGFPDWDTYTQYAGDSTAYQNDLAVAEGWPDAATKEEYGTLERYAQHLKDEADLEARGQAWENEQTAISAGFPNYATYTQFDGDLNAYTAAQNELMAKGAEFPDYKTYMEYGGDLNAYEQDLLERDAIAAGFPDHATQVQYGGSYEAYQAELQEQARLEEERIAEAARIAQAEADAQAAEAARVAQEAVNEELAQSNGFPDYATYLEFDGDQDAYLASLAPPVIEPEEPTEPVLEPPYTPGEDAEEFEPPVGVEPPYTPGEDAEEFVPPYTPGEDAAEFIPPVITEPPYTPGEDAEEFTAPPEVPYTPGEDADEFVPPVNQAPYTPGEDAEEFVPPYTPGEDAGEFIPPYTPGEDAADFQPPYTPGEDAEEFIPPYTPGEDAAEFIPPYTPGEDADEFIPPYTPGEDAAEFEPEEEIDPETGLPRIKIPPVKPSVPPKQTVPPKKPVTPLPPGLTPEQLMQLFGQLGAPFGQLGAAGITGALQPYEMPYYFQIPEEQQFDITEAFSPTLYRLQKE